MCAYAEHPERRGCFPGCGSRSEEGILLLEALIGLAIIGIVVISLLAATGSQVRLADKADVLLTAAALAQDRLATIQLMGNEDFARPPDSLLTGSFPAPFDEFTWNAEVEEAEGEYDLFAVRIIIAGRGETLPLETLIHRPAMTGDLAAGGAMGAGGDRGMGRRVSVEYFMLRSGGRGGREMMGLGGMARGRTSRGGRDSGGTGRTGQQGTGRPPPGQQGTGRPPPGTSQPPPPPHPPVGLNDGLPEGNPL